MNLKKFEKTKGLKITFIQQCIGPCNLFLKKISKGRFPRQTISTTESSSTVFSQFSDIGPNSDKDATLQRLYRKIEKGSFSEKNAPGDKGGGRTKMS